MYIIKIKNLGRSFSGVPVLENVSLEVPEKERYGVYGLPSSGKMTLVRIMLDILNKDTGVVEIFGKDSSTHRSNILSRIAYIPEEPILSIILLS